MDKQEVSLMVIVGVLVVALFAVSTMASSLVSEPASAPHLDVTAYKVPVVKVSNGATTSLVIYKPESTANAMLTVK